MQAIRNGDDARMLCAPGRPYADYEFEAQPPNLVEKGGRLEAAIGEDAHPEPGADGVRYAAQQVPGQRDGGRGPFTAIHPVPDRKLQGPVVREENYEVDTVNLVVDANERELASRFRDTGEVDTQPQARMMFSLGHLEEGPSKVQHAVVSQSYVLKKRLSTLGLTVPA